MAPPAPYKQVDLLLAVRKIAKYPSDKLAYPTQALGPDRKAQHEGFELWTRCMNGDEDAWARMRHYNETDVKITEALYGRLLPWIPNHPSYGAITGQDSVCTNCGSSDLRKEGGGPSRPRTLTSATSV